jgi:hypothetical protein
MLKTYNYMEKKSRIPLVAKFLEKNKNSSSITFGSSTGDVPVGLNAASVVFNPMGGHFNFHLLVQFSPYDVNMPIWDLLCFAQQLGLPPNLTTKI